MKPEPEQDCMECLTDELKPENVAPVHDESRLFVDSQVGKGVYGGAKKHRVFGKTCRIFHKLL